MAWRLRQRVKKVGGIKDKLLSAGSKVKTLRSAMKHLGRKVNILKTNRQAVDPDAVPRHSSSEDDSDDMLQAGTCSFFSHTTLKLFLAFVAHSYCHSCMIRHRIQVAGNE